MIPCSNSVLRFAALLALCSLAAVAGTPDKKADREEGEFKISFGGKEVGTEEFVILASGDSIQSTSELRFRNPADSRQRIGIQTKLQMTGALVPVSYRLESDVNGEKGSIVGNFSANQAIFEYHGAENSRRQGLLVGERFTVLDTNVFHHFALLARAYFARNNLKADRYEVVIPQEYETGFLRIKELDKGPVRIRGKPVRLRRLQVDSGSILITLWIDDRKLLQKIEVPSRQLEVERVK